MKIQTARAVFKYDNSDEQLRWIRNLALQKGADPQSIRQQIDVDKDAEAAIAYVNHGRWVADCPSKCGGAMLVEPDEAFMCGECFNAAIGGKWRLLRFPLERTDIESILEVRSFPTNRNWKPGEGLKQLRNENTIHALAEVSV